MKIVPSRLAVSLAAFIALPAFAQTVATVNGTAIPQARADVLIAEQKAQGAPDSDQLRNAVKEELIRREVLAQEARKKGSKSRRVQAQIELARQAVLIRAYLQDFVKAHPVSDADVKAEYDKIKSQLGDKEYKARHILVEKEEDAKAIIAKLDKGEKFEELAKQSKDPGSKDKGGDLGWANPAGFVKPFAEALTKLEKGKYTTTPVKTDFGYHVIKLEDSRALKAPAFDEVKGQLKQRLEQQRVERTSPNCAPRPPSSKRRHAASKADGLRRLFHSPLPRRAATTPDRSPLSYELRFSDVTRHARFRTLALTAATALASLSPGPRRQDPRRHQGRGPARLRRQHRRDRLSAADSQGQWRGLDVDVCRAIAAAVLGDANKVRWVPLSSQQRFTALQSGEVDILSRNTTWSLTRDAALGLHFTGVTYYDGQGFMVAKKSKVSSAKQLKNAEICVQSGTTTEKNLSDYFRAQGIKVKPVVFDKFEPHQGLLQRALPGLHHRRLGAGLHPRQGSPQPRRLRGAAGDHLQGALGPAVRRGDDEWFAIVKWTVNALIEAEELGITQARSTPQGLPTRPSSASWGSAKTWARASASTEWAARAVKAAATTARSSTATWGPIRPQAAPRPQRPVEQGRHPVRPAAALSDAPRNRNLAQALILAPSSAWPRCWP
jgi:peptidyl-prolyl cis-trans isomerase C